MEIPHKDFLIMPGAREDTLGRWMPLVSVRSRAKRRGVKRSWTPMAIVLERHKSREEAVRRSVEIAMNMIARGDFKHSRPSSPLKAKKRRRSRGNLPNGPAFPK
jgi:hypothetical protein